MAVASSLLYSGPSTPSSTQPQRVLSKIRAFCGSTLLLGQSQNFLLQITRPLGSGPCGLTSLLQSHFFSSWAPPSNFLQVPHDARPTHRGLCTCCSLCLVLSLLFMTKSLLGGENSNMQLSFKRKTKKGSLMKKGSGQGAMARAVGSEGKESGWLHGIGGTLWGHLAG